jgi:hypothetical protein
MAQWQNGGARGARDDLVIVGGGSMGMDTMKRKGYWGQAPERHNAKGNTRTCADN